MARHDVSVSTYDAKTPTNRGDAGSNIKTNDDCVSTNAYSYLFVHAGRGCNLLSDQYGSFNRTTGYYFKAG